MTLAGAHTGRNKTEQSSWNTIRLPCFAVIITQNRVLYGVKEQTQSVLPQQTDRRGQKRVRPESEIEETMSRLKGCNDREGGVTGWVESDTYRDFLFLHESLLFLDRVRTDTDNFNL